MFGASERGGLGEVDEDEGSTAHNEQRNETNFSLTPRPDIEEFKS